MKAISNLKALRIILLGMFAFLSTHTYSQDLSFNSQSLQSQKDKPKVQPLPIHGMLLAENNGRVKIASGNGRFIFHGVLHDRWAGRDVLTLKDAERAFNFIEMKGIGVDLVDVLKPYQFGTGEKNVVLFIDPYCSACSKILSDLPRNSTEYTFNLIPIAVLGEDSKKRVKNLVCAQDQQAAKSQLVSKQYRDLKEVESCDLELMTRRMFTGQILGIKGIPFMIRHDGLVSRGNPALGITAWLEG